MTVKRHLESVPHSTTMDAGSASRPALVAGDRLKRPVGTPGRNPGTALDLDLVGASGLLDHELFESIYNPGKLVLLAGWRDAAAAQSWRPGARAGGARHRRVRVIRDYGMFERREATQFYPPIEPRSGDAR